MDYTEVNIKLQECDPFAEILIAKLDQIKFESYAEDSDGLRAYIKTNLFNIKDVKKIISDISTLTALSYKIKNIKKDNWNSSWETNYSPAIISKDCVIRASFHDPMPDYKYEIIITPKMSFGTGHHETTSLIMNEMLKIVFQNKNVLDMGSGTGVLSIFASLLGAFKVVGIDSDEWAFKNSHENSILNRTSNISFVNGNVSQIGNQNFDIILANINLNTILNDLDVYVGALKQCGEILLSGFLEQDNHLIIDKCKLLGLKIIVIKNKNKWQMIHLRRV